MKKISLLLFLWAFYCTAFAQIKIDFGRSPYNSAGRVDKRERKLIQKSYRLPFYVIGSVADTTIIKAVRALSVSRKRYYALYIGDSMRVAVEIEKYGKKGYEITTYSKRGNIKKIMHYNEYGFASGWVIKYNDDGRLWAQGSYKYGEKSGVWKYYDSEGRVTRKEKYIGNNLIVPDNALFSKKAYLLIVRNPFWYEAQQSGRFIVKGRYLYFYPKHNRQYLQDIKIPVDSIMHIACKFHPRIVIATHDSSYYKFFIHRKKLLQVLDSISGIKPSEFNIPSVKNSAPAEGVNASTAIHFSGSTIYTPVKVNGYMEMDDGKLIFKPLEYCNYIREITIKKEDIKTCKAKGKGKLVIKLKSGVKYRFITTNSDKIVKGISQ